MRPPDRLPDRQSAAELLSVRSSRLVGSGPSANYAPRKSGEFVLNCSRSYTHKGLPRPLYQARQKGRQAAADPAQGMEKTMNELGQTPDAEIRLWTDIELLSKTHQANRLKLGRLFFELRNLYSE